MQLGSNRRALKTIVRSAVGPLRGMSTSVDAQCRLYLLVNAYKKYGHLSCQLDPLGLTAPLASGHLDPARYGLRPEMTVEVKGLVWMDKPVATVAEVQEHLKRVYCGTVASQFTHLESQREIDWLSEQLERSPPAISNADRQSILQLLYESELFDQFLGTKFVQLKRYGGEGMESLMVAMDQVLRTASGCGVQNVVIGMPHRGRLNFCVNIMQYAPERLFTQIMGNPPEALDVEDPSGHKLTDLYTGDVLSHIGGSVEKSYANRNLHVSMMRNPSHLEAINPVSMGKTRALQDSGSSAMCVLVHGDAALPGQGINQESMVLTHLPHFRVGGTIHVVANNQIGYTTNPHYSRSTRYSFDLLKPYGVPLFAVNAEDPEAVRRIAELAVRYRDTFQKDVGVEVIGYRKYGHNELDEPRFTQPRMYRRVDGHASVVQSYGAKLTEAGVADATVLQNIRANYVSRLEQAFRAAPTHKPQRVHLGKRWKGMKDAVNVAERVQTGVDPAALRTYGQASIEVPQDFAVHQRLERTHIQKRKEMLAAGKGLDWATAEAMAFGSLLAEGFNIRISGQDVPRGTFSQRHAQFVDQNTEKAFVPLKENKYSETQGDLHIVPSPLAELSVVCYEYGYSIHDPKTLSIWEAQFGDFVNGAHIALDQFVSTGEAKWHQQSSLVLLLPHGYDGAGPEHSSSKPERFLQMCTWRVEGDQSAPVQTHTNMVVAFPTTPANYFHLLRRQMKRSFRKPLVVVGPKTLLRLPEAVSSLEELGPGTEFQPVIDDPHHNTTGHSAEVVVLCSGKFYYELVAERAKRKQVDRFAFIRVEELSPLPFKQIIETVEKYTKRRTLVWAQEEPMNMGAYAHVRLLLDTYSKIKSLPFVGRPPAAACATGIGKFHKKEVEELFGNIFAL